MDAKADIEEVLKGFEEEQLERSKPTVATKASLNIHCGHFESSRVPEVDGGWLLPQIASFKLERKQSHNCSVYLGACVTLQFNKYVVPKKRRMSSTSAEIKANVFCNESTILIWYVPTNSWLFKVFKREMQFHPLVLMSMPLIRGLEAGCSLISF